MKRLITLILLYTFAAMSLADNRVVLFGGGPMPEDSQVSIEKNTLWILSYLQSQFAAEDIAFYYTDGNGAFPDVRAPQAQPVSPDTEMLTRVFRKESELGIEYRQNLFDTEHGSAAAYELVPALDNAFQSVAAGDTLTLIYQGHGGYRPANTLDNYFRLWNGTELTVTDMASLMSRADANARIRFLFPQCFSGAFSRVIYKNADSKQGLSENTRCGFLAQPEYLESEGCTDSVYTGDYRDYSSYFFSALSGNTIGGQPIPGQPDLNSDGTITLREAHLYTLEHARSIDYSRSTSEDYLENWQPWYLKWAPSSHAVDNEYAALARRLLSDLGYTGEWRQVSPQLWKDIRDLEKLASDDKQKLDALNTKIRKLQNRIQLPLLLEWPYLKNPYGETYLRNIVKDLPSMYSRLEQDPAYQELQALQQEYEQLEITELEHRRNLTQRRKVIRFYKLANLLDQFGRHGSEQEQQDYQRLLSCEDSVL